MRHAFFSAILAQENGSMWYEAINGGGVIEATMLCDSVSPNVGVFNPRLVTRLGDYVGETTGRYLGVASYQGKTFPPKLPATI